MRAGHLAHSPEGSGPCTDRLLPTTPFDRFKCIPTYAVSLKKDGLLFVSGFYTEDFPMICSSARRAGLEYMEQDAIDNWCCAGFRKV